MNFLERLIAFERLKKLQGMNVENPQIKKELNKLMRMLKKAPLRPDRRG